MRVDTFTPSDLATLHGRAQGNGTPLRRGSVTWAADLLDVDRRTVSRWLAGDTRPTTYQVARLRVAARIGDLRRRYRIDREAGVGIVAALARSFRDLDDRVEAETQKRMEERAAARKRANRRFDRAAEIRNPDRHPFAGVWRRDRRGRRR